MDSAPASAHLTRAGRATLGRSAQGLEEVRRSWRIILQATLAATLAYAAALAIGHEQPFFAPIAAIATVAVSLAHRLRRSAELLLGNAVGIFFADLLIAQIGTGVWQLGLVVAIALTTAIMVGGGPILIMQASSAGILIATLTPPTQAQPWNTDPCRRRPDRRARRAGRLRARDARRPRTPRPAVHPAGHRRDRRRATGGSRRR